MSAETGVMTSYPCRVSVMTSYLGRVGRDNADVFRIAARLHKVHDQGNHLEVAQQDRHAAERAFSRSMVMNEVELSSLLIIQSGDLHRWRTPPGGARQGE